jgi:caa(3)-type oxidase subunit IV
MDAHSRTYVVIWAALLVALLASLGLGGLAGAPWAVAAIFVIATIKAAMVVAWYMHLAAEPRFLKVVFAGAVGVAAVLFVGVYPDVALSWSGTPAAPEGTGEPVAVRPGDPARGAKVYGTYCVGCHQADGRGNAGALAADFVGDATRLAKTDAELLASIRDGKVGAIGAMPPWRGTLTDQQQADALAYVRATFGGGR